MYRHRSKIVRVGRRQREKISTSWFTLVMSEFVQINLCSLWNLRLLINQMTDAMVKDILCKIQLKANFLGVAIRKHHYLALSLEWSFDGIQGSQYQNYWNFEDVSHCCTAIRCFWWEARGHSNVSFMIFSPKHSLHPTSNVAMLPLLRPYEWRPWFHSFTQSLGKESWLLSMETDKPILKFEQKWKWPWTVKAILKNHKVGRHTLPNQLQS